MHFAKIYKLSQTTNIMTTVKFIKPFLLALLTANLLFVFSCKTSDNTDNSNKRKFGIFKVLEDNTTVEMNGVIGGKTLNNFNKLMASYPNINKINMNQVPGSKDDETNLLVSKRVHDLNIDIHLMDNAEIASGGVDFFIAGIKRTRGTNTKIGVHSWGGGKGESATDYPVGHEFHLPYINYYKSVGFSQDQAEKFYYFTINSAPANDIYWMTDAEVAQYGLLTE